MNVYWIPFMEPRLFFPLVNCRKFKIMRKRVIGQETKIEKGAERESGGEEGRERNKEREREVVSTSI